MSGAIVPEAIRLFWFVGGVGANAYPPNNSTRYRRCPRGILETLELDGTRQIR